MIEHHSSGLFKHVLLLPERAFTEAIASSGFLRLDTNDQCSGACNVLPSSLLLSVHAFSVISHALYTLYTFMLHGGCRTIHFDS
jgi:hypothetical protein